MHKTRNYGSKVMAKGLMRDHSAHREFKSQATKFLHSAVTLPAEFDLRARVAPPESQLACGGCWAFSITNSLRSAHMLAGKDPGALSKNWLLLNMGPVAENGCNGGDFDAGKNMLSELGPCLESLSPFTGSTDGLVYPSATPVAATAKEWLLVGDGWSKPTAQQLCQAIYNGGKGACLSVDIAADGTLENYSSGIIDRTTSTGINHMVRVVGYNAGASIDASGNVRFNEDGSWADPRGAFFIGRNNWDLDWGIDGDFLIGYGVNNFAETAMLFSF